MYIPRFVKKYKEYLAAENQLADGTHYLFKFENNLGASLVTGIINFQIGTWEMAQIIWDPTEIRVDLAWDFYYNVDIVDGIQKGLNEDKVLEYLDRLKDAPAPT